jgi:hypothetical protein
VLTQNQLPIDLAAPQAVLLYGLGLQVFTLSKTSLAIIDLLLRHRKKEYDMPFGKQSPRGYDLVCVRALRCSRCRT